MLLSMLMLLGLVASTTVSAQSDGFFRGGTEDYSNRDGETSFTVNTQDFGQEVPLGSGIVILLAAGTGYVALRKNGRKTMKKMAVFAAAFVLTLGLSQCKKDQLINQITETSEGGTVHITVNVGDNGSKADITNGHITFKNGEKLYVGYNNAKVGVLTYSSSTSSFSGDLAITQDGDDKLLYFYYMGGGDATMVDATHYTVDISNQTSNYPVISCGTSTKSYTGAGAYKTTLFNKCGLVKFSTSVDRGTVNVGGMITEACLDFGAGEITPGTTTGVISFNTNVNGEGWAILLEQDAVNGATVTASGFDNGTCNVPEITNNLYYTTGVSAILQLPVTNTHEFTINDSYGKVYFSKGNLEGSNGVYSFAEDYHYVGSTYFFGYANVPGWRILTSEEWIYLFTSRDGASSKWGFATISGIKGVIILPDDYNNSDPGPSPYPTPTFNSNHISWDDNNIMMEDVWYQMENNGAVFLPADHMEGIMGGYGECGFYWSSTSQYSSYRYLYFGYWEAYPEQLLQPMPELTEDSYKMCLVRVVRDVN